jgi:hypothetical protein
MKLGLHTIPEHFQFLTGIWATAFAAMTLGAPLGAKELVYDGFQMDSEQPDCRSGWTIPWGVFDGEVIIVDEDLEFEGLSSTHGLLQLKRDTVSVCQMDEMDGGTFYGSFRIQCDNIVKDALVGFAICESDATVVRPDTSRMSLLVKGWRSELGALTALGNKKKIVEGEGVKEGEPYLVLFKVVNSGAQHGSLTMWVLSREQVADLRVNGFNEDQLSKIPLGDEAGQLCQRMTAEIAKEKKPIFGSGLIFCLISRYNSGAQIDEIRVSDISLAEAAGLKESSIQAKQYIPYISK